MPLDSPLAGGLIDISPSRISYSDGGLEAIPHERIGRPQGSGAALSDVQASQVQQIIDTKSPEDLEIASPLWNRRAIGELIRKRCNVVLAVRTVGKYLRRWGYTAKKPRRQSRKRDPEEVRQWLEQTYPAIKKRAEKEQAESQWCDETGVVADQCSEYGYARRG